MLFRRVAGILLAAFTLHLNVLGADFACAKHGPGEHESNAAVTAPVAESSSQMHEHPQTHGAATDTDASAHSAHGSHDLAAGAAPTVVNPAPACDVPVQPNCCKALTSCSVYFSASSELDIATFASAPEVIAPHAMTAPPSERSAPEPPPPKA